MLQGRTGRIEVVYVAQLSSLAMLSPGAITEIESDFSEIEQELRAAAAEQLRGSGAAWEFARRQGIVADELIASATALRDAHAGRTVAIVVGSSSHAAHRVVGSIARQPGPSFAGASSYRALAARRNRRHRRKKWLR